MFLPVFSHCILCFGLKPAQFAQHFCNRWINIFLGCNAADEFEPLLQIIKYSISVFTSVSLTVLERVEMQLPQSELLLIFVTLSVQINSLCFKSSPNLSVNKRHSLTTLSANSATAGSRTNTSVFCFPEEEHIELNTAFTIAFFHISPLYILLHMKWQLCGAQRKIALLSLHPSPFHQPPIW